jgi:hypothetical protein
LQFTQEVKLGGSLFDGFVDFVGGVFYINEQNRTDFADIFTLPIGRPDRPAFRCCSPTGSCAMRPTQSPAMCRRTSTSPTR